MMIPNQIGVLFCRKPVDMRKSIDGLSILVAGVFERNPMDNYLFVFRNRRGDKLKILYWDRNGYVLYYKRLEKGRFYFPAQREGACEITYQQLSWLLDGLDYSKLKGHPSLSYKKHY